MIYKGALVKFLFEGRWRTTAELKQIWGHAFRSSTSRRIKTLALPRKSAIDDVVITGEDFKRIRAMIEAGVAQSGSGED